MSNAIIALLVALSAAAWSYAKLMRSTGGNAKSAATAAGIIGVLIFALVLTVVSMLS